MKIVCLESNREQATLIVSQLGMEGHQVALFHDGREVIRHLQCSAADLLVLNQLAPTISGIEVTGWVREHLGRALPILLLTGRELSEDEAVAVLDSGADSYIVKPLRGPELIARVRALLRRAQQRNESISNLIVAGPYTMDLQAKRVMLNDQLVNLSSREFELAAVLFRNLERVVQRDLLRKLVWGGNSDSISRTLDTHIYRLRKKMEFSAEHAVILRVIYSLGYQLHLLRNFDNGANGGPATSVSGNLDNRCSMNVWLPCSDLGRCQDSQLTLKDQGAEAAHDVRGNASEAGGANHH